MFSKSLNFYIISSLLLQLCIISNLLLELQYYSPSENSVVKRQVHSRDPPGMKNVYYTPKIYKNIIILLKNLPSLT